MLVIAQVSDRAKLAAYAKALGESGLYEANQGYYAAIGKPVGVFEGDWGEGDSVVIAKFPSKAAAEAFWHSDAYANAIKPLREGAGTFRVALFHALPVPERIGWEPR
jgi:uncharacterized protein (DUF1330 family)